MNKVKIKRKLKEIEEERWENKARAKKTWYRLEDEIKEIRERIVELEKEIQILEKERCSLRKEQEESEFSFEKRDEKLLEEKNALIKAAADLFLKEEEKE